MSELGQARRPSDLVPGDPEGIRAGALVVRGRARTVEQAARELRLIDLGSWQGDAATRFREQFGLEPKRWFDAADALWSAADALDDLASAIESAQSQAARAMQLWDTGESLSRSATARYATFASPTALPSTMAAPFVDPGDSHRRSAAGLLATARSQVSSAAIITTRQLRAAAATAPRRTTWLEAAGTLVADAGGHVVNGLASLGNAALHHPGAVGSMLIGGLVVDAGMAGEFLGFGLDATGLGAAAGVPVNVASSGLIATGAGMISAGAGSLASHASAEDLITPMARRRGADTPRPPRGGGEPRKSRQEQAEQAGRLGYPRRVPPQKAPFNSRGEPVFTDGKDFVTPDVDGHNVSNGWKIFNRRAERMGTYDWDLNRVKD